MEARLVEQRQVLAVLLAVTALIIPVAGAVVFSASPIPGGNSLVLGAVGFHDILPILMLLGALTLVVTGPAERSPLVVATVGLVLAASAVLTIGYLGSAFEVRPGGPFDFGDDSALTGWSRGRLSTILLLLASGALSATTFGYGLRWMAERRKDVTS